MCHIEADERFSSIMMICWLSVAQALAASSVGIQFGQSRIEAHVGHTSGLVGSLEEIMPPKVKQIGTVHVVLRQRQVSQKCQGGVGEVPARSWAGVPEVPRRCSGGVREVLGNCSLWSTFA